MVNAFGCRLQYLSEGARLLLAEWPLSLAVSFGTMMQPLPWVTWLGPKPWDCNSLPSFQNHHIKPITMNLRYCKWLSSISSQLVITPFDGSLRDLLESFISHPSGPFMGPHCPCKNNEFIWIPTIKHVCSSWPVYLEQGCDRSQNNTPEGNKGNSWPKFILWSECLGIKRSQTTGLTLLFHTCFE